MLSASGLALPVQSSPMPLGATGGTPLLSEAIGSAGVEADMMSTLSSLLLAPLRKRVSVLGLFDSPEASLTVPSSAMALGIVWLRSDLGNPSGAAITVVVDVLVHSSSAAAVAVAVVLGTKVVLLQSTPMPLGATGDTPLCH